MAFLHLLFSEFEISSRVGYFKPGPEAADIFMVRLAWKLIFKLHSKTANCLCPALLNTEGDLETKNYHVHVSSIKSMLQLPISQLIFLSGH